MITSTQFFEAGENMPEDLLEQIGYDELLAIVETFMTESGLRRFCRHICGGECCTYERCVTCQTENQPKLSCALFMHPLCGPSKKMQFDEDWERFMQLAYSVNCILEALEDDKTRNIFFHPLKEETRAGFHFPKEKVDAVFTSEFTTKVRRQLELLIRELRLDAKWMAVVD